MSSLVVFRTRATIKPFWTSLTECATTTSPTGLGTSTPTQSDGTGVAVVNPVTHAVIMDSLVAGILVGDSTVTLPERKEEERGKFYWPVLLPHRRRPPF